MSGAGRDEMVRRVLHGEDTSLKASLLRGLLMLLAWLHQAGLEAYLLPYRTGLRKRYRLRRTDGTPVAVVAIGNLASGGTGKTPMTALVSGHLAAQRLRVAILSRGHGGDSESGRAPRLVSDGERVLLGPDQAGDEPTLLANLLPGVPVVVGRDRRASGQLAVETFAPDVIVCDDALQYWQLARDINLVLLDARRPFDNGHVLPRGLLREPPRHLSRAQIAVLTRADKVDAAALAAHVTRARQLAPTADVFTATHAPQGWVTSSGQVLPLAALRTASVGAFSGIADGAAFRQTVGELVGNIAAHRDFVDHHAYSGDEVAALDLFAPDADAWVTTEKDLVKVAPLWPNDAPPLYALRVAMQVSDPNAFFAALDARITASRAGASPAF